jgi:hypothetical protein
VVRGGLIGTRGGVNVAGVHVYGSLERPSGQNYFCHANYYYPIHL